MENSTQSNKGMQITLVDENNGSLMTLWLPAGEAMGRFSFEQFGIDCFFIEAYKGSWNVVCKPGIKILNYPETEWHFELQDKSFLKIGVDEEPLYALFAETNTDDNIVFHKYSFFGANEIKIGREVGNDIRFSNPLVSGKHAVIRKNGDRWEVQDTNSTNGTYLNNKRIINSVLGCGDVIYFMGAKIIFGINFLAINLSGDQVWLNPGKFKEMHNVQTANTDKNTEPEEDVLFNRSPRRRKALVFDPIHIEAPPMSANGNKMPLLLRMGSSLVMGTTAALSGNIATVLTSLLFPLMTNGYSEKEKKDYEERRHEVYNAYLEKKKEEIEKERLHEQSVLRANYPDLKLSLDIPGNSNRLWERKKTDDDFLLVRVGEGDRKLLAEVSYPMEQLNLEEDELEKKMREVAGNPVFLKNVPIQTSVIEDYVCGVTGPYEERLLFIHNFILQLVTFHSYDEVKIVFLGSQDAIDKMTFVKYLPHIWNDERNFRFLASDTSSAYRISEYLKNEYESLDKKELKEVLKSKPYYVVLALDKKCFDSMEYLKEIIQEDKSVGISVLAAFDDLPKECSIIFNLSSGGLNEKIYLKQLDKEPETFMLDKFDPKLAATSTKILFNTKLKNIAQSYSLPKTLTFLEMFGAGKIEHLNIENRWKTSNPVQSLATPIGVGTDGSVFTLDLHQKFQGPHGLVAGTTGSGKSEFLLTYILSLAVNYDPDEVAFVLIDYKGGGLAGAFDDPEHGIHLPHLVGTITNLDGSAIQRSLIAIQSEILRRQRVFNEVKNATEEGTMDIYTYQRLYRNGTISEPMPHLFIISDEFAELKQQEPEFMEKLISAARIGRSLGVHLILATQKPSGVVNDQIRSNTKFRVCLKVQDKADSQDMLMRPEAAELKDTGRFYLQVGYNEFFALGQSAWSGANYTPQNEVVVRRDDSVEIIDETGQTLSSAKIKHKTEEANGTQLVAIVKYISNIANKRGRAARQIWEPALENFYPYSELMKHPGFNRTGIEAIVGLVDDPENLIQFPLKINLISSNNIMLIGDLACGKTTLLQTMFYDLTVHYSPEQLNYYFIDCSNHSLRAFKDAPQCGAWLSEDDEGDIERLFELLDKEIKRRKKLFTEENVSSYEMYIRKEKLPYILFVIDNAAGLTATKNGEKYYTSLGSYMKRCSGLGIQFIISVSHLNELYSKTKQEMNTRLTLTMKDKYTYADVLNAKCEYLPAKTAGRGLVIIDERVLEYQTAVVSNSNQEIDDEWLKQEIDRVSKRYQGMKPAESLPRIDEEMEYSTFCKSFTSGRIPIGFSIDKMKPVALPIKQLGMLSVFFGNEDGIAPIFKNFIYAAKMNEMEIKVIKKREKSIFEDAVLSDGLELVECEKEQIEQYILQMTDLVVPRINHLQEYTRKNGLKASRKDIYKDTYQYMSSTLPSIMVFIESFYDLVDVLGDTEDVALAKLFAISRNIGIYYVAGFYPGERVNSAYQAVKDFNPDKLELYLGGQFDKQFMGNLPSEFSKISDEKEYNTGVMKYKDKLHPVLVPCGELIHSEKSEDDKNIF